MTLFLQKLIEKDHSKHGCHDEIQTFRIDADDLSQESPDRTAGHPVDMIQSGNTFPEAVSVDAFRYIRGAVDRKCFVCQCIDQIPFAMSGSFVFFKHCKTVEQVSCLHHDCYKECLQKIERSRQHGYCEEFQRTAVYDD